MYVNTGETDIVDDVNLGYGYKKIRIYMNIVDKICNR